MRLSLRRAAKPDPLREVRQATAELEQLLIGVTDQLGAIAADAGTFTAGVTDTATRMRKMAAAAKRNARESPSG